MKCTKRNALIATNVVASLAVLYAIAGTTSPVRADDDDKKLLDKKPAVVGPIYRGPDPWKVARLPLTAAELGFGDDTFESKNVLLKSWIPLNNFPGFATATSPNGADCWGYTSPSGREYALMGLSWGNGIVEVTDPANPVIITTIPGSVDKLWRDITVIGHYAYAVSDSGGVGIQVMDLSNIDTGSVTLVRNYMQGGHTTTHSMVANVDSGYLYLQGGNAAGGGIIPANCNIDPTFPTFTGPGWTTSYVHESIIVTYPPGSGPYAGKEIAFLFRGNSSNRISIVDITNKASPVTLSSVTYPGQNYSHQGWLSEDRKYLYHNDEIDGPSQNVPRMLTRIFDISDLSAPRLISSVTNGLPSVDHNEYVKGRYLYQSNYTSGLRVWDLIDPLMPVEIAWLDTRPENDGTGYNGAWGNYPYFNSGTILISDIERGLFTVKLSILELTPTATPSTILPGVATPVSVTIAQRDATVGSASLMVSTNGGPYTAIPMTAGAGDSYSASIPPAACFDRVSYYIRALTNDAQPREFTWPLKAAQGDVLTAYTQTSQTTAISDNFETDTGWTVQNTTPITGPWTRVIPLYNGGPGAVVGDADGSGRCFVTGNSLNQDVDGGPTRLLSPVLDLSAMPEARISVSRWFFSMAGVTDELITEISNNNGSTWIQVEAVGPVTGGWKNKTFRVADFVTPTAQVRVRFSVSDADSSTTEAGIDAFKVIAPVCAAACYANCDGSTIVPVLNVNDFICFQNLYAAGDPMANCDGSSLPPVLNVNDFICFQNKYAAGCP